MKYSVFVVHSRNTKSKFRTLTALLLVFLISLTLNPLSAHAAYGGGQPTVFNPNVFTSEASLVRVDGPTGALTHRIPIEIPPGRNGIQPDLALEYNSQNTEDGITGYGWDLSIPYIQRLNKTGVENLYAGTATFSSSLDGELVEISSGNYRARVDSGAYNAYSFTNNTWTVYDKNGTRFLFGSSDSGRQYDTATTSVKTYTWMLQEIRDTNDNYTTFTYSKDGNQLYPYQVSYTGNASSDGPFLVNFATSTRPDVRESYASGFKTTTRYRVSEITTSINGAVTSRYILSYGSGANGIRSLLTSVQRQGYAEDGVLTALPAATFAYASSSVMFSKPGSGGLTLDGPQFIPADVNGNGINDISYFYDLNNGTGKHGLFYFDQSTEMGSFVPPDYWANNNGAEERGVRYVDSNGDGKADVVKGFQDDQAGTTTSALYFNTYSPGGSYGWAASTTYNGVVPPFAYKTVNGVYVMTSGLLGEVNGDGLPDYVMSLPSFTGSATYLGNGSAWTSTTTAFGAIYSMPTTAPTGIASQLIDINGDGLDDWLSSDTNGTYIHLNNGNGWSTNIDTQWTIATSTLYYSDTGGGPTAYYDRGIRFMDINGDSLPDFVRAYVTAPHTACALVPPAEVADVKVVLLNTGNGWATSTAYTLPQYITVGQVNGAPNPCNFNGAFTHQEYANWSGNGQMAQDVITKITYPEGGSKNIIYTPSAQLGTNQELPTSLLVVKETAENDGFGSVASTTYAYGGGKLHLASGIKDRKFAGFAVATTTAPDSVTATYYHQGDNADTALGEQNDSYARINRPFREDIFDLSNNLKQRTYYRWDTNDVNGSVLTALGSEMSFSYGTAGAHKDSATEYAYNPTTRDVTQIVEYGEVSGSTNGTFSDLGTDKRTTNYTYVASSTVNISLPKSKTLLNYSSATTTDERYYYDGLSLGSVTKGNRTKIEKWISGITYINEQTAYNSFGLPTSSTDPRGKQTTYTYDSYNLHIATSTNPLSQSTQYYYDYSLGKPKQTIDVNGRIFETAYDGIDRPLAEKQPDIANPGTLVTKKAYSYTDTVGARKVVETNHIDGLVNFLLYKYLDGLDRVIQTRKEAEENGDYSVKDFAYNAVGLLKKESLPYFSNGSSRTTASTNANLYTNYTYDALKRPASVANAVGTTTNSYNQWTTTVTDPLNNVKDFTYDAFKRLAQVVEHDDTNEYTTAYTYDVTDNLIKITDADGNVRNFTYDGLGRRLTAQDLHDAADGTFGTWTYGYDAAGNLTSQTDPKSQTTNFTYDDINRTLTEDYTGQAGTEVTYAYDSCAEGVGRICTATSTGATTQLTYNALGLTASEAKTIDGTNYTTSYTYNRQGNPTGIVYPDNSEVQYTYNTAGLLETIAQKESGGSFLNLVSDFDYAPTEKVTFKAFANGVQTTYTYDANALYRLTNILTATPGGGGGGGAFLNGFWSTLARATEELPLALKHTLALGDITNTEISSPDTDFSLDVDTTPDTPPVDNTETAPADTSASTTETILSEPASEIAPDAPPPAITVSEATTTPETATSGAASTTPTAADSAPFLQGENATSTEATVELPPVAAIATPAITSASTTQSSAQAAGAGTAAIPPDTVRARIAGKDIRERATIKGEEIAKINSIGRTERGNYGIEIVSMRPINGGVEAFVRAWKQGKQIGFGQDGTVEIERFQIFNPPILILDPTGDIYQELERDDFETGAKVKVSRTLREDPKEALLQVIEHNLSVMKSIHGPENIIQGTVGRTTSTFFPNAGTGAAPVDGVTFRAPGGSGETWSTIRAGSGTSANSSSWYNAITSYNGNGGSSYENLSRSFFGFDASPLSIGAPKTIVSATLSIRGIQKYGSGASQSTVVIDRNVPSNESQLSAGDFNLSNWDGVEQASNRVTYNGWNVNGYNNFTLNATGTSNISTTTNTWFGTRARGDFEDDAPVSATSVAIEGYFADKDGTAYDPQLIVEHTSSNNAPLAPTELTTEGLVNPSGISNPTPALSAMYNDPETLDLATAYRIQVATSSDFAGLVWDSAKTNLASSTPANTRIAGIPYAGSELVPNTTYYWRLKFWDYESVEGAWSTATSTFVLTFLAPTAPLGLLAEGQTNPLDISDPTPEFSAVFADPNAGDSAIWYQLQVATTTYFGSPFWDSNKTALATTSVGSRIPDVSYGGSALASSTAYFWRIRLWDQYNNQSPWSTVAAFTLGGGNAPSASSGLQNLSYTYDAVGNITQIQETATSTGLYRSITYTYDPLYRLTSAATIFATSTPYLRLYAYSPTGSITYTSNQGTYTATTTGYQNPHAVHQIANGTATTTFSYDNNGNLTGAGSDTYTWDWKNRMTASNVSSVTTSYGYDHTMQRVFKSSNNATTTYPSKYVNYTTATTTKHIFTPDGELIATIIGSGATTTKQYIHTDHLGGINIITDATGQSVLQALDYYPFGATRINTGTVDEQRKFVGEERDTETNLSYLNARYYDGSRGQFLSQDPTHLAIGNRGELQSITGIPQEVVLLDPQLLNSYAYAKNNPLRYKDPEGKFLDVAFDVGFTLYSGYKLGAAIFTGGDVKGESVNFALDAGSIFVPGAVGLGTIKRTANAVDNAVDAAKAIEAGREAQSKLGFPNVKAGSAGGETAGKRFSDTTKSQAYSDANGTCVFCGNKTTDTPGPLRTNADHSIPRVQGGNSSPANAQNTCQTCNLQKGGQTGSQFIERIRSSINKQ